jgi:2-polyprenyl-3-methyl-5-hydroxy-6-metoxy-1,4-benzoquinol methylase
VTHASDDAAYYDQRWSAATVSHAKRLRGQAIVAAAAREGQKLDILELGCGTGWLSNELAALGACLGVDLSPLAIAQAQQTFSAPSFLCADLAEWRPPRQFDVVVSHEVLEHLRDQNRHIALAFDALEPGGILIMTTPNAFAAYASVLSVRHDYQPQPIENWLYRDELEALLEHAGFHIERLTTIVPSRSYRSRVLRGVASQRLDNAATRVGLERPWSALKGRMGLHEALFVIARRPARP